MTEPEFTGTYKTVTNYREEQPSSLEHHIDSKTKYEKAKFVLWSDCFTSKGDVRMIPINDVKACWWLTTGEMKVESPYHQECSGEHYAQQKQKKAEQDLDSIADGMQTEVQNHETYRQKDLQERLRNATELIERIEPKKAVSLSGIVEAFFSTTPVLGTAYMGAMNLFSLYEMQSYTKKHDDYSLFEPLLLLTMFPIALTELVGPITIAGTGSDDAFFKMLMAAPMFLALKSCINYAFDKYKRHIIRKDYESLKQQIEAQTKTTELPDKTKHADKTKVKENE